MTNAHPSIAYREAAVRGAEPVDLVIMLYDIVVADLQSAVAAFAADDIETRSGELKHALAAIEQLQGTLDLERGADAARQLDGFYDFARAQILQAQLRQSPQDLKKLAAAFVTVKQGWEELRDRQLKPVPAPAFAMASAEYTAAVNWTA